MGINLEIKEMQENRKKVLRNVGKWKNMAITCLKHRVKNKFKIVKQDLEMFKIVE